MKHRVASSNKQDIPQNLLKDIAGGGGGNGGIGPGHPGIPVHPTGVPGTGKGKK